MAHTFLLGVGAMKAGTTWLHRYLSGSAHCEPGHRKEYHVFDVLDLAETFTLTRVVEKARASLDEVARVEATDPTFLIQSAMLADEGFYFDYFCGLFSRSPHTRLTLDITPGYARLDTTRLSKVRDGFEGRGVRCVSAFLMRDPVQRILSQVRMQQRRRPEQNPGSVADLVAERFAEPSYAERTRYEETIARQDEVFGDLAWLAFYEEIFDPHSGEEELRRLCALVGIDYIEPDLETRFNASSDTIELPESTTRVVAEHFRPTYEFVASRFPERDLARIWPSARLIG